MRARCYRVLPDVTAGEPHPSRFAISRWLRENLGVMGTGSDGALFEVGETSGPPRRRAPAGAAKTFRHYDQAQSFLLPPSLDDWLPEAHEARFISEVVEELLDLSVIYDSYVMADGAPPYAPRMMLKLLLLMSLR